MVLSCLEGKRFSIIDLHSGVGSMIPSSNLYCMDMEDTNFDFESRSLIVTESMME